ncbi:minor capsid protein [Pediococcus pentosaceus]|uniref:minor capsid protein n=1 Tax=Pediococcus pentosaceus TaxID=1255 RepID=UPI0013303332|nr:minor capsid protein [Pediococcus pentosaceus]KAF0349756.1 phage head morphogenesis protein [Pediococcus pentosaceus]MBF7105684.1 minor capsid protein [Pediococcus pentosaceus]
MMGKKNSDEYWKQREQDEQDWINENIKNGQDFDKLIQKYYDSLLQNINKDISEQYIRYGKREGYTLSEARKKVSQEDINAFSSEAKRITAKARTIYKKKGKVEYADFSDEVNTRLRLYNATMRINRLEMLKAQIGLEMIENNMDIYGTVIDYLNDSYINELKRQAGILASSASNVKAAETASIVMATTGNANFSERLWANSDVFKARLDQLLTKQMVQGLNPTVIARDLKPYLKDEVKNARYVTERLARTETSRVQGQAQLNSFRKYGYKYVKWIAEPSACKVCASIAATNDGVYTLDDVPTKPVHPNCMCSFSAWYDKEE